jgi:hypothetical protein
MIFTRTLAVSRLTICVTPPPLPFQQFGIAVPKAVAGTDYTRFTRGSHSYCVATSGAVARSYAGE